MTQDNLIALVIASTCGAIASAYATEYLVEKFNRLKRRIKH
ncbi:hypothetical protein SEA_KARDASHIAN_36 [Streptomyces phage Kardashian]|nr:hypothetical protein SEA_KARDASHIAN_36 [Streptomyces phage Kardashian]